MQRARALATAWTLIAVGILGLTGAAVNVLPRLAHAQNVKGAAFTTVDESVDGTGHCKNGNPNNNCNIYNGKDYVWMSGGPISASLGPGTYFFAVLDPGGQNAPNDGASDNLSYGTHGAAPNDAYTNRTFTLDSKGHITYTGTHTFDATNNKLRLMYYDDTENPGGEYILAICSLANGYPVDPSDCKYDAFKVVNGTTATTTTNLLSIDATVNGADTKTYTWGIQKSADKTNQTVTVGANPSATATVKYAITVTHDAGTLGDIQVSGSLEVFNFTLDSKGKTAPVTIDGITDQLSNGTTCTVPNGGKQSLTQTETDFTFTCALASLPPGTLTDTATLTWPAQNLGQGTKLSAGSATVTTSAISFATTTIDNCAQITDTIGGISKQLCSTAPSPSTITYDKTLTVPAGACATQLNIAQYETNTTHTTGSASQTVQACDTGHAGAALTTSVDPDATFTKTYTWGIQKSVDKTSQTVSGGANALFNYTVTVTHDAGTVSDIHISGNIEADNPNAAPVQLDSVTDTLSDGTVCTVTVPPAAAGLLLPPGATQFPYTCAPTTLPTGTLTGTADITWSAQTLSDGTTIAAGEQTPNTGPITFVGTMVDGCATVDDSLHGSLGTLCATDPSTTTYQYAFTLTAPTSGCASQPNTASFVTNTSETPGTASTTVQVCIPPTPPTPPTIGRSGQGNAPSAPTTAQAPSTSGTAGSAGNGAAASQPAQPKAQGGTHVIGSVTPAGTDLSLIWFALLAVLCFALVGSGAFVLVRLRQATR